VRHIFENGIRSDSTLAHILEKSSPETNKYSFFFAKKKAIKKNRYERRQEWGAAGQTCTRRSELPIFIHTRRGFEGRSPSFCEILNQIQNFSNILPEPFFSSRKRLFFEKKLQRFATKGQWAAGGKKPGAPLGELRAGIRSDQACQESAGRPCGWCGRLIDG